VSGLHQIRVLTITSLVLAMLPASRATGQSLSICEIQSETVDGDVSVYDGDIINCDGGICVGKYAGYRPRIILHDPEQPDEWGGIQVKDWTNGDLFDNVELGDLVTLTNVYVEEFRNTTILQWDDYYDAGFAITSQDNPLPEPIIVSVSEIPAPIYEPSDEGWYVQNHEAERYESMRLIVRDIAVTAMHHGKARDNYNLENSQGQSCWAADYMNEDVGPWDYHPFITTEQHFCSLAGVFEQYTLLEDHWDYYQLVTLTTPDLAICGDGDSDGDVDLDDLPRFVECLVGPLCDDAPAGCDPPAWTWPPTELPIQHCLMMDLNYDGDVDVGDFAGLQAILGDP